MTLIFMIWSLNVLVKKPSEQIEVNEVQETIIKRVTN